MKIVVLCGGLSTERNISFLSGTKVCRALRSRGHQAVLVDLFMGDHGEHTKEIIWHAKYYLICTCVGLPFYVANNLFSSVYEVKELLKHVHLNYFLEVLGFALLYGIGLGYLLGPVGIWIAYPLTEATTLVVNFILVTVHNHHFPRSWMDLSFPHSQVEVEEV